MKNIYFIAIDDVKIANSVDVKMGTLIYPCAGGRHYHLYKKSGILKPEYVENCGSLIELSKEQYEKLKANNDGPVKNVFDILFTKVNGAEYKKCESGRYIVWYKLRPDIVANGENLYEACKNLIEMYGDVKKFEEEKETLEKLSQEQINKICLSGIKGENTGTKKVFVYDYETLLSISNIVAGMINKKSERITDPQKPPIGIIPQFIWREQRANELMQAISRANFINCGKWMEELAEHTAWFNRDKKCRKTEGLIANK